MGWPNRRVARALGRGSSAASLHDSELLLWKSEGRGRTQSRTLPSHGCDIGATIPGKLTSNTSTSWSLTILVDTQIRAGYAYRVNYRGYPLKSITLSRQLAISGLLLIAGLTISDIWLTSRVLLQRNQIQRLVNGEGESTPFTDAALPLLSGHRLGSDQRYSVIPAGTASLTLLVFRESCPYCEANWKNWDALFRDNKLPTSVVLLSATRRSAIPT